MTENTNTNEGGVPEIPAAPAAPEVPSVPEVPAAPATDADAIKAAKAAEAEAKKQEKAAKAAAKAEEKAKKEAEKAAKKAEKEAKAAEKKAAKPVMPTQNGITAPRPGKCADAWNLATELSQAKGETVTMGDFVEAGKAAGLNEGNMRTEYARWRKFHGLPPQGRKPKEKKADEPTNTDGGDAPAIPAAPEVPAAPEAPADVPPMPPVE